MKQLTVLAGGALLLASAFTGCKPDHFPHPGGDTKYPDSAQLARFDILYDNPKEDDVNNTGFGSAIVQDDRRKDIFYLMTDRGPNVDGLISDTKVFVDKTFTPRIGVFQLIKNKLHPLYYIDMKRADGTRLTGLPNPAGAGGTGETAYDLQGNTIAPDPEGIDPEGLAQAPDGSFWISDEYGPHILHIDVYGRTLERINPYGTGTGGRTLPLVFAKRRANRGMEGLTITPDGKTLVGIMQSPLYNPSKSAVSGSRITRILTYNIATGASKQYVYVIENKDLANSEITAITNNSFLVLERDGEFPLAPSKPAAYKRIYKISLAGATDISDASNGATGKLYGGKTVEELKDPAGLAANGIVPVSKSAVVELLEEIKPFYSHDKPEGITIINKNLIAVSNDDDFGIINNDIGGYKAKILPATGKVDKNVVYFIKLSTPLK